MTTTTYFVSNSLKEDRRKKNKKANHFLTSNIEFENDITGKQDQVESCSHVKFVSVSLFFSRGDELVMKVFFASVSFNDSAWKTTKYQESLT